MNEKSLQVIQEITDFLRPFGICYLKHEKHQYTIGTEDDGIKRELIKKGKKKGEYRIIQDTIREYLNQKMSKWKCKSGTGDRIAAYWIIKLPVEVKQ